MGNKKTFKEEGYTYCYYSSYYGGHVLENQWGFHELWFANKNHASFGLIYKNTHLEFARSLKKELDTPISFIKEN
ncbi:MAG: hypothetical protein WA061_01930 [Microgenomates group bacterium]